MKEREDLESKQRKKKQKPDFGRSFISCSKYKKARGLVVLGEGKGAVML